MIRIILDMDEVLCQTNKVMLEIYNDEFGDSLKMVDIKSFDVKNWVKPECGESVYEIYEREGFYKTLEPVSGAIEGTRFLLEMGHDVVIASASPINSLTAIEEKKQWVRDFMPYFPLENFVPIKRKELLRGDMILDDGPHNLAAFEGLSIRMERPWNASSTCHDASVGSWPEFISLVKVHDARL